MSWFSRLVAVVRHPVTYRLIRSIDEAYELVKETRVALKDGMLSGPEIESCLEKMEALLKSLLGLED